MLQPFVDNEKDIRLCRLLAEIVTDIKVPILFKELEYAGKYKNSCNPRIWQYSTDHVGDRISISGEPIQDLDYDNLDHISERSVTEIGPELFDIEIDAKTPLSPKHLFLVIYLYFGEK